MPFCSRTIEGTHPKASGEYLSAICSTHKDKKDFNPIAQLSNTYWLLLDSHECFCHPIFDGILFSNQSTLPIFKMSWKRGWCGKALPSGCSTTHLIPFVKHNRISKLSREQNKFPSFTKVYPWFPKYSFERCCGHGCGRTLADPISMNWKPEALAQIKRDWLYKISCKQHFCEAVAAYPKNSYATRSGVSRFLDTPTLAPYDGNDENFELLFNCWSHNCL